MPENVVLLHGFGGTHRAWDGVASRLDRTRYRVLAIDLPGHGEAADLGRPISFTGCVEHVLARAPERFALCGYSMGGRIALQVALAAPARVQRLVLVSSTPGIEDAKQRAARQDADRRLADELERIPFEEFIVRWRSQPLFASEPPEVNRLARADQRRNRPTTLAAVLRGIGTGAMESLWQELGELRMPVTIVVGDRDTRYRQLGERMVAKLADGELVSVPGGHGLPLENPDALAQALERAQRRSD